MPRHSTLAAWALGPVLGIDIVSGESTTIKGYQVQIEEGAWRGIFNHKNALGAAMALAILVEWHLPGTYDEIESFEGPLAFLPMQCLLVPFAFGHVYSLRVSHDPAHVQS